MRFSSYVLAAAGIAAFAAAAPTQLSKRISKLKFFGVNESGPEFGQNNLPGVKGTDYVWPTLSTIDVRDIGTSYVKRDR